MGDVIRAFPVRSGKRDVPRTLRLYFDTGSPHTFIKRSRCAGFANIMEMAEPADFGGLGNGRFLARAFVHLEVRMLGIWCRQGAYVVEDDILEPIYDVLVGHDFMQKYDIAVRTRAKRKGVLLNRDALVMAQRVRRDPSPLPMLRARRKQGGRGVTRTGRTVAPGYARPRRGRELR